MKRYDLWFSSIHVVDKMHIVLSELSPGWSVLSGAVLAYRWSPCAPLRTRSLALDRAHQPLHTYIHTSTARCACRRRCPHAYRRAHVRVIGPACAFRGPRTGRDAVCAGTRRARPIKIAAFPHQQAEKSPQNQHVLSYNPKQGDVGRVVAPQMTKTGGPRVTGYLCVMGDLNPQPAD